MADGDDLRGNTGLPIFPERMPLWHRILCVLGYHKPEIRINNRPDQCWGDRSRMRDACGRCGTYMNTQISDKAREAAAMEYAIRTYPMPAPRKAEFQAYVDGLRPQRAPKEPSHG
ncbi:MAG TPA: hypothetical protein VKQ27_08770 [Acetobacteraceae bacterium]|nr:hypothetical protein [Acetobacteraceae bacterium]